jgi:hypothetical protein
MQSSNLKKILGLVGLFLLLVILGFVLLRGTSNTGSPVATNRPATTPAANTASSGTSANTPPAVQLSNTTTFKDVSGGQATGDANRNLKDSNVTLAVRVEKLPDLPVGSVYAVFLTDLQNSSNPPVFVGSLSKSNSGDYKGDYLLGSQGPKEWLGYKRIVVAVNSGSGSPQALGKIVLEGSFVK